MRAVISSIFSNGNGGWESGFIAIDISFMGLSSAATRFPASVDDRPLAIFSDPNAHRVHDPSAVCFPISRLNVQMQTAETVWAMIAVVASRSGGHD